MQNAATSAERGATRFPKRAKWRRLQNSRAPSPPDPTEAIQLKDENEQRAADAERRDISGTPSQPLSEASQVTALTELAEATERA